MANPVLVIAAVVASLCTGAVPASAATIIDNPLNGADGSCVFATTCGAAEGASNPFAAQSFTLAGATMLSGASLTTYLKDIGRPFAINWRILSAAVEGLPGTIVAQGSSAPLDQAYLGEQFGLSIVRSGFDVAGTTLAGGSYYLALQAATDVTDVYLATADGSGAAYTADGGSWAPGYATGSAIAVSLSGESLAAVPEPATWGMMIVGFGLASASIRRRRGAAGMRVRFVG